MVLCLKCFTYLNLKRTKIRPNLNIAPIDQHLLPQNNAEVLKLFFKTSVKIYSDLETVLFREGFNWFHFRLNFAKNYQRLKFWSHQRTKKINFNQKLIDR